MKRMGMLLLAGLLGLSGCSPSGSVYGNFRAVEDLQLVQTMGFDWHDGEITVTVSSGEETEKLPSSLLSASAPDIPQAIELLQDWSAREDLFFAHIRYVLVGEEAARQGLDTLLDWFERAIQTRLDLPVFVVEGGSAKDLICSGSDRLYEITAVLLSLERDLERRGRSWPYTLRELAAQSDRCGAGLCTSVVMAETAENVPSAKEGVTALETGYAVFRDRKLCAFSGIEAAEGISLLLGRAGAENILLSGGGESLVTLELGKSRARLRPGRDEGGRVRLTVELDCSAGVVSAEPGGLAHEALTAKLETELRDWMQSRTAAALALSAECGADFLELGRRLGGGALSAEELSALEVEQRFRARVDRGYDILFAENVPEGSGRG